MRHSQTKRKKKKKKNNNNTQPPTITGQKDATNTRGKYSRCILTSYASYPVSWVNPRKNCTRTPFRKVPVAPARAGTKNTLTLRLLLLSLRSRLMYPLDFLGLPKTVPVHTASFALAVPEGKGEKHRRLKANSKHWGGDSSVVRAPDS